MKTIKKIIEKIKFAVLIIGVYTFSYVVAFAADTKGSIASPAKVTKATTNIKDKTLGQLVTDTLMLLSQYILKVLLAVIILVFLYGLMKYMFKGQGSDTARSEGRKLMLWGVIGIFVITSLWSIVAVFSSLIGHNNIVIPQFK